MAQRLPHLPVTDLHGVTRNFEWMFSRANIISLERSVKTPEQARNLELYVSSEDGKLYFKDSAGESHALY